MKRKRSNTRNFTPTAIKVASPNGWVPHRGGIRL